MTKIEDFVAHRIAIAPLPALTAPGYEYVLGRRGVYLRAKNRFIDLCLLIGPCDVRGLPAVPMHLRLTKMPPRFLAEILQHAGEYPDREIVYYVTADDSNKKFELLIAKYGSATAIDNLVDPDANSNIVAQVHSHGRLRAYSSPTDDANEHEFRVYGVVGRVDQVRPEVHFRVGVYGYHFRVNAKEVFGRFRHEPSFIDTFDDEHLLTQRPLNVCRAR